MAEPQKGHPVATIAGLLNLTERRVQQLAKDGIIPKAERGLYNLVGCVKAYVAYLQKMTEGRMPDEVSTTAKVDKSRLITAQARKAELEASKAEGNALDREDVQTVLNEAMTIIATGMDSQASRLSGIFAKLSDPAIIRQTLLSENRQIRAGAADKLARLGAIGDGSRNPAPATAKKPRPVGKRKARTAKRKPRARAVSE